MICCRPGTPDSRGSAVGLLLALSFFLAWKVALASSAERTTTASGSADPASFDRDVVVSSPRKAAALAQGLDLGAEDAGSSPEHHRSLGYALIPGDTTDAPVSTGNTNLDCDLLTECINGCHSRFYKVTGGTGQLISASTCAVVTLPQRLYVWKGSSSDCSTFTCTGTFAARIGLVWFGSVP
jgi:hypothetical protein